MKIYSGYKDNKRLKSRHKAFRGDIFVAEEAPLIPRGGLALRQITLWAL